MNRIQDLSQHSGLDSFLSSITTVIGKIVCIGRRVGVSSASMGVSVLASIREFPEQKLQNAHLLRIKGQRIGVHG